MRNKFIYAVAFLCFCTFATLLAQTNYPQGLMVGDTSPDFSAKDQDGKMVNLKNLAKKGDVVNIFYRGQWCPYCNQQLKKNDSMQHIMEKWANVLAITPETGENVQKTVEKTKASFPIIEDMNLAIM